ncbi:SCO family protein [Aestuariivirga sp.]|uniref:SCO family protein n=1 Tax=Aestuariivirga sp. TaxID=2650926 RepID=UPI0039E59DFB
MATLSRMSLVRILMIVTASALITGLVLFLQLAGNRPDGAGIADIGGPFRLASSRGGDVDSKDLHGKPYGIFFGFTHCPEVCPTTLYEMSHVLGVLGSDAKDFRLFFVTVDPERDTAPILKDYLSNFDPRIEALVPTPEQLPRIARDFRIFYQKVPDSDGGYTMDHTATLFLMGRDGKLVSTIAYGEEEQSRITKIRKLMAGS